MPKLSFNTLATGDRQLVVHEAFDIILCSGVVLLVIYAHTDGDILFFRRSAYYDLFCPGL